MFLCFRVSLVSLRTRWDVLLFLFYAVEKLSIKGTICGAFLQVKELNYLLQFISWLLTCTGFLACSF